MMSRLSSERVHWLRYGAAIATVALATLIRWPLVHAWGELPPFILYFPPLALLAVGAGGGPAALATLLSVVAAFTLIPDPGRLHVRHSADIIAASIFMFGGGVISLMAMLFERSRRQVAAAAQREAAERLIRHTGERFALLSETAGLLLAAPRPQEVVERLCRRVMAHLDCDVFFNFLADQPTGRLHLNACAGIPPEEAGKIEWLDYGVAVCGCVARERKRIIAEDIPNTPDNRTALVKSYGVQAYCCHPLMAGDRLIGTLSFGAKRRARFADDEVELMRAVADQVAVAMERIRDQAELHRLSQQRQLALDAARLGWWHYDPATKIASYDQRYAEIFAVSGNQSPSEELLARLHPDDLPRVWAAVEAALNPADPKPYATEYRIFHPDRSIRWVEAYGVAIFEGGGNARRATSFVGTVADITQRKQAEEALAQAMHLLDAHMENSPLAVIEWGPDMRLSRWSREAERIFGWSAGEVLGKRMWDFRWVYTEDAAHVENVSQDLQRGVPRFSANRNYRKDGSVVLCHWYNSTLLDDQGRFRSILSLVLDVTEQDRTQRALQEAKATAENASRAKDQFIAVLSHELRTPLTPAVAAVSLLRRDRRLPADVHEDLDLVSRNLDLEVRLIADLLDVSRVISGKLHMERAPTDVAAAIREAGKIVASDLEAKGQTLVIDAPKAPYLMSADAARLQQVFWNLLRNSIKFSPNGSRIEVRCQRSQRSESRGQTSEELLTVDVVDQGSGISPEMLPRLFNVFEQDQKARSFGGLGLGLSICRAVVEMHGGLISAHSEGSGRGATFTVRLPIAALMPSAGEAGDEGERLRECATETTVSPVRR